MTEFFIFLLLFLQQWCLHGSGIKGVVSELSVSKHTKIKNLIRQDETAKTEDIEEHSGYRRQDYLCASTR